MLQEQTAEQAREHAHGQEEAWPAGDPARAVGDEAAAGDDAMQMRMMEQVLAPGVQHGEEADLGAQMLRIGGDGAQGLGGRLGRGCRRPRALFWEAMAAIVSGHREDDVEVLAVEQLGCRDAPSTARGRATGTWGSGDSRQELYAMRWWPQWSHCFDVPAERGGAAQSRSRS